VRAFQPNVDAAPDAFVGPPVGGPRVGHDLEDEGGERDQRHQAQRDREVHRIYPAEPEPEEPANRARDRFLRESLAVNMRQDEPAEHEEEIDGEIPARDRATYRPVVEDHD